MKSALIRQYWNCRHANCMWNLARCFSLSPLLFRLHLSSLVIVNIWLFFSSIIVVGVCENAGRFSYLEVCVEFTFVDGGMFHIITCLDGWRLGSFGCWCWLAETLELVWEKLPEFYQAVYSQRYIYFLDIWWIVYI